MVERDVPVRGGRPVLDGSMRSRSFLQEHQQYQPPQHDNLVHQGIDSIVDHAQSSPRKTPLKVAVDSSSSRRHSGVPSPAHPPKIVDSGLNHTFSHQNCQPSRGSSSDRMVATLMYKTNAPRAGVTEYPPDRQPSPVGPSPTSTSSRSIPPNLAPVRRVSLFPLEPPPPDSEPLDHLYGSYISPLCMTSFLHLIASLPVRQGSDDPSSSHRCLDNSEHPMVVELTLSPPPDPTYITLEDLRKHELTYRFEQEWNIDVVLQRDHVLRRYPRLVVFDMDSTLIEQEVIDLIASSIGAEVTVSAITARAMCGELDFAASFRERAMLLKGVDGDIFTKLRSVITLTKGVKQLIRALKKLGCKTAVLSGGFIPLTQWLADDLGIDYAYANTLETDAATAKLTGLVIGDIVDGARKRDHLLEIAKMENIGLEQVVAVGDGANDLLMMAAAGTGVAFRAKPLVQLEADVRLNGDSLLDLLYIFGFTEEEVRALIA